MLKSRTVGIVGLGFALLLLVAMSAYTATADTPPVVQDPVTPDRSQPEVRDPGYSDTYMELLSISGQEFTKGSRTFFPDVGADPRAVEELPRSLSWTPVRRVTVDPNDSQTLYASIDNGYGVYRSTDGGVYWKGIFTGCSGRTVIFANDDTTALAALGDSNGSYYVNCAVLRSDDGGNYWFNVSAGITRTVVAAAFDPTDARRIYAATLGAGIYRTTDSGETWMPINVGLQEDPLNYVFSIAVCPSNPNILYAGGLFWVYRSDNGGNTWYIADNYYPCFYTEGLAIRPSDCNTFYTGGRRLGGLDPGGLTIGGFFKSTAGAGDGNLILKNNDMDDTFVLDIAQDPLDPDILYAATWASGVFRSDDGGVTWQPKNAGFTNPYVYSIEATQGPAGTVLYAGTFYTDAGLFKSTDRGENWTEVSQGSALYRVIFDAITTGSVDNLAAATSRGTYWSVDGGQTWSPSTGLEGGQHGVVLGLAGRPTNPARLLAATYGGGIYASADAGRSWVQVDGYNGSDYVYELAFRPGSNQVYAATYGVQSSNDAGLNWLPFGNLPDWVRTLDARSGTHPDVFAGTNVSGVHMSPDGNGNWVAINNGLDELRIRSLKATAADTLFAGTNGSSGWQYSILTRPTALDGQAEPAGVRGTDAWTKQGPYILAPGVIQIAVDPTNTNRIYAGTDQGVYRSTDGGETWVPKNQGLGGYGDLVISGMAIDPNNSMTVYLATWGYGIFKSTDRGDHWVRLSDPLNSTQMYLPMVLRNLSSVELPDRLYSTADATVIEGAPSANFGGTSDMWVGYDHCIPAGRARSLVRFDTSAIPPGTSISQARLSIYLVNSCDIGERTHRVAAYRALGSWSESGVTWNSQPSSGAEYGSVWVPSLSWGRYQIDVTSLVQGWVNGTIPNYGLMLRSNESSGNDSAQLGFGTRDASGTTYDPYIAITYAGRAGVEETTLPAGGSPEPAISGPTIRDALSGLPSLPDAGHAGYTQHSVYEPE